MSLATPPEFVAALVTPIAEAAPVHSPTHVGVTVPLSPRRKVDPALNPIDATIPSPVDHDWQLTAAEREEISHSITQTWTDQAIKCYMGGADCAKCEIPRGNYSFVCQMDKVVAVLLDTLGQPDVHRVKKLFPPGLVRAMRG
jgi:hypothetical protein